MAKKRSDFPKLCAAASLLPSGPDAPLTDADIVRIACSDCPFYKEGEDEDLECGAFVLLRHLLRKKVLTVEAILAAVRAGDGETAAPPARGEG